MSPPIIGYRAWRVEGDTLRSVFRDALWTVGGRMGAVCIPSVGTDQRHPAPYAECDCGIYARTTLDGIFVELWDRAIVGDTSVIIGAVAMFGSTYHGKSNPHVIRAQYAQPICLLAMDAWYPARGYHEHAPDIQAWEARLQRVAQRYGLPLIPRSGIAKYAAEFGEPLSAPADERVTDNPDEPRWRCWPWGRE
jgi:hypothetical protein